MNIYGIIILSAIIISFILDVAGDYLNLKNLKPELPDEFKDTFDQDKYRKSQEYTRTKTRFGFYSTVFSLIVFLVFWFAGGFNWLDQYVSAITDLTIYRGLIYIGILMLAQMVISMPFSIYSTFVIEEKFGFNKTTTKTFILDTLKSILLAIVIGGPLIAAVLYILDTTGNYAWLYGWGAVTLITIVLQYLAPTVIMPLFNKFEPLEDGELKYSIMSFARKVNFPLKNVVVMDASKRSTKSNAFFTGFGKNRRIALFDTLIKKMGVKELTAVLAHEIGHYKKKHVFTGMAISIVHLGILFFLLQIFLTHEGLYQAFYMDKMEIYTGLLFFGILYSPVEELLSIFMNMRSRKNEYQADRFAAENYGEPEKLISALKKLSSDNLTNLTPHPFYVKMNYSHPPVLERISTLREIEQEIEKETEEKSYSESK